MMSLLGGVALFLFGMSAMGDGLKNLAGNKMETYLWKLSSTPGKAFLLGILVTAVIQSSSATSVMAVSFRCQQQRRREPLLDRSAVLRPHHRGGLYAAHRAQTYP